ncbi:MAG: hypothetical protein ACHRXM_00920 [Isosphaerales bacterium]
MTAAHRSFPEPPGQSTVRELRESDSLAMANEPDPDRLGSDLNIDSRAGRFLLGPHAALARGSSCLPAVFRGFGLAVVGFGAVFLVWMLIATVFFDVPMNFNGRVVRKMEAVGIQAGFLAVWVAFDALWLFVVGKIFPAPDRYSRLDLRATEPRIALSSCFCLYFRTLGEGSDGARNFRTRPPKAQDPGHRREAASRQPGPPSRRSIGSPPWLSLIRQPGNAVLPIDTASTRHGGVIMSSQKPSIARRRQEKQRKRQERLNRKQAQRPFDTQTVMVLGRQPEVRAGSFGARTALVEVPGLEKMSDVLEDFVDPYIDMAADARSFRSLLALGVAAWNAALLPVDRRMAVIDDALRDRKESGANLDFFRAIIQNLIDRKLAHFSANRRAILGFDLKDTGDGYYLRVVSSIPNAARSVGT